MHIFYFLTVNEHFNLLREIATTYKEPVLICFRRFSPSGFPAGFEICSWEEDLTEKFVQGGFCQIYLTLNKAKPTSGQDWEFPDREEENIIIIEGGRVKGDELEEIYLRVFSKMSNCNKLYQKIRAAIRTKFNKGLSVSIHFYKDIFYSSDACMYKMVSSFGGHEYKAPKTK